ncbi:MAG: hypothetical protein IAE89_08925 [Anaerolineae bacterium]|nr:hypothetical protein [Anaerolineae bacterium]
MLENTLAETLPLNGTWQFELAGQQGMINVPSAWEAEGCPDTAGPAVYRRSIDIPTSWADAKILLQFGAVSYFVEVYLNGSLVGAHEGLWTAFDINITPYVRVGQANALELRVTKPADDGDRFPYRDVLVGFIPYISTTFGGVWQDVKITAHRAPLFSDLHLSANSDTGNVTIRAQVIPPNRDPLSANIVWSAEIITPDGQIATKVEMPLQNGGLFAALTVENQQLWSPESPSLYRLQLTASQGGQPISEISRSFGFRKLETQGERLLLNDEPIFLRGILSWGWNPRTLAPNFSEREIREEFRRVRAMGFNLFKLCLYVPAPRLFEIADEEGMLLWLEMPMWLPRLSDHLREQAAQEYAAVLGQVHHHPSVIIYSLGCELSAEMADAALLESLDGLTRGATTGVIVCDNSGSGEAYGGLTGDYADFNDYHFYCDLHYFTPLCDHFRRDWRPPRPWIFGEFCDSDDYRNPADLVENGERMWWRNLLGKDGGIHRWAYRDQELLVDPLNLPFTHAQMQAISRQQSFIYRKRILETVRARRDIRGYVLTGLRDTPIFSGGIFDDLGRSKYPADSFKQFNNDAVLLLEQGRARVWQHGGDRPAPNDKFNHLSGSASNFRFVLATGEKPVNAGDLRWAFRRKTDNSIIAEGVMPFHQTLNAAQLHELGAFEIAMPQLKTPEICELTVELDTAAHLLRNVWTHWLYPPTSLENAVIYDPVGQLTGIPAARIASLSDLAASQVLITALLTGEIEAFIRAGGKAVLLQSGEGSLPARPLPFWRESIKLLYSHPALSAFPHEGYADLQFYNLATDYALDTASLRDKFGADAITPIITRLDARLFHLSEYLVEISIGAGKLFASTLHFSGGAGDQVQSFEANIAGQWLLGALLKGLIQPTYRGA